MDYKEQVEMLQKDMDKFKKKMDQQNYYRYSLLQMLDRYRNDSVQYEKRSQRLKLNTNIMNKKLQSS